MPVEKLPQGIDRDDYVPPPAAATQISMAREATIEFLNLSGAAQCKEAKDPWRPAALGMWADAVEDEGQVGDVHLVEAMRLVVRQGYRPYCCTPDQDRWSWFDLSKKIEEMDDPASDVESWLFVLLQGGKAETNFRVYPSGICALEDMITSLTGWFASGRRLDDNDRPIPLPRKEGEDKPTNEPEMQ